MNLVIEENAERQPLKSRLKSQARKRKHKLHVTWCEFANEKCIYWIKYTVSVCTASTNNRINSLQSKNVSPHNVTLQYLFHFVSCFSSDESTFPSSMSFKIDKNVYDAIWESVLYGVDIEEREKVRRWKLVTWQVLKEWRGGRWHSSFMDT